MTLSSAEIFKCYVAVIWGSGKICNQLPPASAVAQQTKAARGLEVSDPNMASCCLLYTETDGCTRDCTVYTWLRSQNPSLRLHNRAALLLINSSFLLLIYGLSLSQFVLKFPHYLPLYTTFFCPSVDHIRGTGRALEAGVHCLQQFNWFMPS